jgi:hypothetical protein
LNVILLNVILLSGCLVNVLLWGKNIVLSNVFMPSVILLNDMTPYQKFLLQSIV